MWDFSVDAARGLHSFDLSTGGPHSLPGPPFIWAGQNQEPVNHSSSFVCLQTEPTTEPTAAIPAYLKTLFMLHASLHTLPNTGH